MTPYPLSALHASTIKGFGEKWQKFDQAERPESDGRAQFESYFAHFRWGLVGPASIDFNMGCGSGRSTKRLTPRVAMTSLITAMVYWPLARLCKLLAIRETTGFGTVCRTHKPPHWRVCVVRNG